MANVAKIGPSGEVGARFKKARKHFTARILTQAVVAEDLAVTVSHYSKIENGTDSCSVRLAREFCRLYGVNYRWLATGEGNEWASGTPAEIATPGESSDEPVREMPEFEGSTHGRNEICRALVQSAVKATRAALADEDTVASIKQLSRHMGKTEDEVLAVLVWDKVKDIPRG